MTALAKNVVQLAQALRLVRQGEQEAERLKQKAAQLELARERVALAREQLALKREQWRHKVAGELVKKLDEVWAKELALDRTKGNKEKLTILGQHMWGPEFKVERPESELTEEEKQALWKQQAEDEEEYKKEIYAEQDARNALYLEEQRKRKAAGLPPPPNLNGEWPRGL